MRKEDFTPPFTIRECENLGIIGGKPQCSEKEFPDIDVAFKHWDSVGYVSAPAPPGSPPFYMLDRSTPEFLRLIDNNGLIVRDWINFYDERTARPVHHHYDATVGNPIPIIIAAKVAKKVGKEVIKRVEEKRKE